LAKLQAFCYLTKEKLKKTKKTKGFKMKASKKQQTRVTSSTTERIHTKRMAAWGK
jgi:hypothetical protein